MIRWEIGTVQHVIGDERNRVQYLDVRLSSGELGKAILYLDDCPAAQEGDEVQLNVTAVALGLGTGGVHFVMNVLNHPPNSGDPLPPSPGHIMKLRYTPLQRKVLAAEEADSPYHHFFTSTQNLQGMPVLIGELHSMLPVAVCWLRYVSRQQTSYGAQNQTSRMPDIKIAYIMTDGAALPLSFSHHIATLKKLGWLCGTITYGQAYGGEIETINKYTALIAARHILHADVVIVTMGPGITGTGTPLGHTAIESGELINAVSALGGTPVIIPRTSFVEQRERHRGLSHHTLHTLRDVALRRAIIPFPEQLTASEKQLLLTQLDRFQCSKQHDIRWVQGCQQQDVGNSLLQYPDEIRTMGRTWRDDPQFFQCISAASHFVWESLLQ